MIVGYLCARSPVDRALASGAEGVSSILTGRTISIKLYIEIDFNPVNTDNYLVEKFRYKDFSCFVIVYFYTFKKFTDIFFNCVFADIYIFTILYT